MRRFLALLLVLFPVASLTPGMRTWTTAYQSVCQGGVASAPIVFDTTNGPTLLPCTAGQLDGNWEEKAGQTNAVWYIRYTVPTGQTGNYTLVNKFRTSDTNTSHSVIMPYSYICVSNGMIPRSSMPFRSLGNLTFNPQGTANAVNTLTTSMSINCVPGNEIYIKFAYTSTSFTILHNYVSLSTQGNL